MVICLNTYRQVLARHPQPFHHTDHILTFQRLSGMDRQTLPTKIIHYSQRPEMSSVKQVIRHEIHTPALIDTGLDRTLLTMCCTDMPTRALFAQAEAFQTIHPVCFLVVNRLAFPPQLNMNTRATVADPGFRYFPDTQGYRPIILPALPVVNGSALHQQSAFPSDTDTVSLPQKCTA